MRRPRQCPCRFDRHTGRECAGLGRAAHRNYRGGDEGAFIVSDMDQEYPLSEGLSMAQSVGGIERIGQVTYRTEAKLGKSN